MFTSGYLLEVISEFHPTKKLLVETVVKMLNQKKPAEILAEDVLAESGVSKGSMYHHFEDLQDLVETAQVFRYSKWIDASIEFMTTSVVAAKSKADLRQSMRLLTEVTQSDERKAARAERAQALSNSYENPRMAKQMGIQTKRLTDAITDIVQEVKNKGFFRKDVDPLAVSTFIQAYTLGKIVNDYNPSGISEEAWIDFIMSILDNTFMERD